MLELIKTEMGNAKRRVYSYRRRREGDWSSGDCKEPFSQITLQMASTNPIIIEKHSEPSRLEPAGERGVRGGNDPQS